MYAVRIVALVALINKSFSARAFLIDLFPDLDDGKAVLYRTWMRWITALSPGCVGYPGPLSGFGQ